MTICVAGCGSTGGIRESVAPVKAGKTVVAIPDSCEKRIAGKIANPRMKKGDDTKVVANRRWGIIGKLNARIEARDKCASTRQNAFAGAS